MYGASQFSCLALTCTIIYNCCGKMQMKNKNDVWLSIVNESKKTEDSINDSVKKRTGSYYTDFELADSMVMELISKVLNDGKDISKLKFLEPCVGTGNFVFSYLKIVSLLDLKKNVKIIQNINIMQMKDTNAIIHALN